MKRFILLFLLIFPLLCIAPQQSKASYDPSFQERLRRAKIIDALKELVREWAAKRRWKRLQAEQADTEK